jgi:BolA protein|tara:strand:- start:1554 stop:1880 length:327 start_codon:yes stop_codon:yes gene_type:complete
MSIQEAVETRIAADIDCQHLDVVNESNKHNVPVGSESHFRVVVVSGEFRDEKLIARHRRINALLADLLADEIHALALHAYTEEEWRAKHGDAPMSPPCRGGSKSQVRH